MENEINTKAFGKNDIRGIFPFEVNGEIFFYAAKGYVAFVLEEFKKKNIEKTAKDLIFAVCMDARTHSLELKRAVIEGINSTGADTLDLGLAPTPLGYYAEFAKIDENILNNKKITGALIITASHNPSEYNGLKMTFNKQSLGEEQIKEVKKLTIEAKEKSGYRQIIKGRNIEFDIISNYQNKILDMFGSIGKYNTKDGTKKIKVVIDSANATGGIVAPQLYRDLGCEVIELYSNPDGSFPNHHPNPSDIKTLKDIQKKVKEEQADLGIAFDGDSDRIGAIAQNGEIISGDKLLLIYAQDLISTLKIHGETPTIVSEVKCSQVLYDKIEQAGAKAIMTKTGHGYIKSKMKETKALLAGEMSGHTFFKDRYFGYDDAIYAGCRLIEIIAKNKTKCENFKLSDLLKPFDEVFISDEQRLHCPNELKKEVLEKIKNSINDKLFNSKIKDIITIDGLRIIFEDGFALIRQSNTEPVFTLRFEAKTQKKCESYLKALVDLTNKTVEELNSTKV